MVILKNIGTQIFMSIRSLPDALKEIPGILEAAPVAETFPFHGLGDAGLPRGAVIGVSGEAGGGKTECLLRFLAENAGLRVAWVEESFTIFPSAFPQNGVSLERVLFIEGGLWAVHQLLRSQIFQVVVFSTAGVAEEIALRRLQLAAGRARASVILMSPEPIAVRGATPWPIAVQFHVRRARDGRLDFDLIKYRGNGSCSVTGWVQWA